MTGPSKHILVVGAGSAGRRHMRNFAALGCRVSGMDPKEDRLGEAGKEVGLVGGFVNWNGVLKNTRDFDAAVIASPTKFHVDQAMDLLQAGIPVLLEKPLAKTLEEGERLSVSSLTSNLPALPAGRPPLILGYTYRWWPSLLALRNKILDGEIGKVLHARFVMSAHLADWHPWERYQDFFMASRDLGGGALLDESHWIDLMIWFFGMPKEIFARIEKISDLEIETDDNVDLLAFYKNGPRVNMHLDLYGRPHQKSITIVGDKGSLEWSFETELDRNLMFVNLARDFLEVADGGKKTPCGIEDGIRVMRVIEAARTSSKTGKSVSV